MEKPKQPRQRTERKEKSSNQDNMAGQKMPHGEEGHPEQYAGGPEHRGGDAREDRNP